MSSEFVFSLDAKIRDPETLFRAAMRKAQDKGRLSHDEALKIFKPDGDRINLHACLIEMLDPGDLPGCEILNSDASHVSNEGLEYSIARSATLG